MNGVRSPAASKMQGDKKRQGIGVQGRGVQRRNHQGEGECRFLPLLQFPLPPGGVSFAFGTDFIKMKSVICPYLRLTAESRNAIFSKQLSVSSRLHNKFFQLISIEYILLQDFKFSVQAAFGFVSQSAIALIMFAVSKRISLSADSDQMVPPSVDLLNFLPLYLKARTFRFGGSPLISYQFISAAPNEYYKNILIFKGDNI